MKTKVEVAASKEKRKKKLSASLLTFLLLLSLASLLGAVSGHRPVVLLADVDVAPTVVVDDEAA